MKSNPTYWVAIIVLNVALAAGAALLAPAEIGTTTDRVGYEYVGQHPLEPNCPHSIFCYRVLVPSVLERVPLPRAVSWRAFAITANALTGVILGGIAVAAGAGIAGGLIATILYQSSFGANFATFDPFTPDPAVYLAAALLALCWLREWPVLGLITAIIGVFAKETVALVTSSLALAAWLNRPRSRFSPWLLVALTVWVLLLGFHLAMDLAAGWTERGSASADLLGGAFLARWLTDPTLTLSARLLYVFIPFGFGWLYAILGFREAPDKLRALAIAALILLLPLVYVQTVERALATASFVIIPLAAIFLIRVPIAVGLFAAATNGLLTARVGLSTAWLPPVPYLMILAGTLAAVTILRGLIGSISSSGVPIASWFRVTSSK